MKSEVVVLRPGLRRVLAPNPSPMTYRGTNTYLVGEGDVVVIDPGPALPAHLEAIQAALAPGEQIEKILVTHSHLDHSPLARPLSDATGAEVLAAGPSDWGRSEAMRRLAEVGMIGGGEGVDEAFDPDEVIDEGDAVSGPWGRISVLATPGHMANHLSFAWEDALFSGDLVMGWSTSLVSPPDGDMGAFMSSVRRLAEMAHAVFYPGHGDPVETPQTRAQELIDHRLGREAQILNALQGAQPKTARELAEQIYADTPPALLGAAERNVLAHLIDLHGKKQVTTDGELTATGRFHRP